VDGSETCRLFCMAILILGKQKVKELFKVTIFYTLVYAPDLSRHC